MKRTSRRARVAIGSAVVAVAGFAAAGQLSAATESAPPSTSPGSTEPADTAGGSPPVDLDPERDALVDDILDSAGEAGFPLNRYCVAGLVGQIPDEELWIVAEEMTEAEDAVADTITMPDLTIGAEPAGSDVSAATEPYETVSEDTIPMASEHELSPETAAIGQQMVTCAEGDADPALVAEAVAVIEADPEAPAFDMACVEALLTTFSDETLTLIIEDESNIAPTETAIGAEISAPAIDPASETEVAATEPVGTEETGLVVDPLSSMPEDAFSEALSLLICSPELLEEFETMGSDVAVAASPTAAEPAADTTVDELTETTAG